KAMGRLLGFLAPYRWRVLLAVALTAPASLLSLPVPLLIQRLIDHAAVTGGLAWLPRYAGGLALVFATQAVVSLAITRIMGPVGLGVVRDLRHRLYARLQRLDLAYYDRTPTGVIVSRLMDDVGAVQAIVGGPSVAILTDLGTTLAILVLLLCRAPGIALVVVIGLMV